MLVTLQQLRIICTEHYIHPKIDVSLPPKIDVSLPPKIDVSLPPEIDVSLPPKIDVSLPWGKYFLSSSLYYILAFLFSHIYIPQHIPSLMPSSAVGCYG